MSKTLYVGNVPWSTTEDAVRELFAQYGTVSNLRWITDRDTGRFRGFCFVEMENNDDAEAAIAALNDHDLAGRKLRVNEAQERRGGGGGGGRRYGGGGYRDRDNRRDSW